MLWYKAMISFCARGYNDTATLLLFVF